MGKKKNSFKSELHQYVINTQEARRLSSVNVGKLLNSRDYAETLKDNFIRIREIAIDNRRILSEVLYPVLESEEFLTDEQVEGLKEIKNELIDVRTIENLDIPILEKTVSRLYKDAHAKNLLPYMIEQMEALIEAYYPLSSSTSRITKNQKIALDYASKSQNIIDGFLEYIKEENFSFLYNSKCRERKHIKGG